MGIMVGWQLDELGEEIFGAARGGIMPEIDVKIFFPGEFRIEIFVHVLSVHWSSFPFLKNTRSVDSVAFIIQYRLKRGRWKSRESGS